MARKLVLVILVLLVIGIIIAVVVLRKYEDFRGTPGSTKDEALMVGRTPESFLAADEDYFADMDYGLTKNAAATQAALAPYVALSPQDAVTHVVKGRNNWNVWTGGNDRLWDELNRRSVGTLDLLKTISNVPQWNRTNRWKYYGLVNEPCFMIGPAGKPAPRDDRYGLLLDVRDPNCPPDPFENEQKYPGVKIGTRGTMVNGKMHPVGSSYGYATGILGLRLFPNPAFDEKAAKHWNADKYYNDRSYYEDKNLVKPYRVGMSCGFCHIGPNPSNPPADPENPTYANLNSNPGAQYFWVDRIFVAQPDAKNFAWQLFHTSRPGALDTSFVSSDQINNPRTMNAIYNLGARLEIAAKWGSEELSGAELLNKQFNDLPAIGNNNARLSPLYDANGKISRTPHVLKDGADSVGALGALNRVYINIGLFSEEWFTHFIPLVGGRYVSAMPIEAAEKLSSYWKATELQTPDVALFFLATAKPDLLRNAPGGAAQMTTNMAQLNRGKEVFAQYCARCHSSKLPPKAFTDFFRPGCIGPNYMQCWNQYWAWTKTPEFRQQMTQIVMAPDFTNENAMTTDLRVPVTLLETNACSPLATNALKGNIWDNFSSTSYKNLPSVGVHQVHNPYTGAVSTITLPGNGRGFTRPPSLASVWSTAPFLLNNTLGKFEPSGSVPDRLSSFNDGIRQLLWPERREMDPGSKNLGIEGFMTKSGKTAPGWIDRTSETSFLSVAPGFLPPELAPLSGGLHRVLPRVFATEGVKIGPVPKGTPINLLSNIDLQSKVGDLGGLLLEIKRDLPKFPADGTDPQSVAQFKPLYDKLIRVSKCSDFVINRGHYFGTAYMPASENEPPLNDADKEALIEFLKTF